ncbi:unnamed protein product [Mucor circinelloides]
MSKESNWANIYKELKYLDNLYDHELDPAHNDTSFCVYFLLQILSIIKHQQLLFSDEVDNLERDFVVKFWGVVTERLLHGFGLRLKWGYTHLTVHDTVSDLLLKYEGQLLSARSRSQLPQEDVVVKQESVRGSWNPRPTSKTPPPPKPDYLFGSI